MPTVNIYLGQTTELAIDPNDVDKVESILSVDGSEVTGKAIGSSYIRIEGIWTEIIVKAPEVTLYVNGSEVSEDSVITYSEGLELNYVITNYYEIDGTIWQLYCYNNESSLWSHTVWQKSTGDSYEVSEYLNGNTMVYTFRLNECPSGDSIWITDNGASNPYIKIALGWKITNDNKNTIYYENIAFKMVKVLYGDANEDGVVDGRDASLVLTEYAKISTSSPASFSESQTIRADVNFDDIIDARDASMILSYYAYLSTLKVGYDVYPIEDTRWLIKS